MEFLRELVAVEETGTPSVDMGSALLKHVRGYDTASRCADEHYCFTSIMKGTAFLLHIEELHIADGT